MTRRLFFGLIPLSAGLERLRLRVWRLESMTYDPTWNPFDVTFRFRHVLTGRILEKTITPGKSFTLPLW